MSAQSAQLVLKVATWAHAKERAKRSDERARGAVPALDRDGRYGPPRCEAAKRIGEAELLAPQSKRETRLAAEDTFDRTRARSCSRVSGQNSKRTLVARIRE
jgi:hypothetical protein